MNDRRENNSPVSFRFENIGPVKEATLELGGLTVIAGRNNTGKTYIVYSLYGFLKGWMNCVRGPVPRDSRVRAPDEFPEVKAIRESILGSGHASVPVPISTLARHRKILAKSVGREFSPQFRDIFNSSRDRFRNARLDVEVADVPNLQPPSLAIVSSRHSSITVQYVDGEVVADVNDADRSAGAMHLGMPGFAYYVFLLQGLFPDPFILSAERFGVSLFYRELDFTKSKIVDLLQKHASDGGKSNRLPYLIVDAIASRYAAPIKDNIDFTRSIPDLPHDPSPLAEHKLFDNIKNMMEGYYSNTHDDIRFISKARKKDHFNIPLHLASSSARGLSDLYFFLRYAASRGRLLIIDEPESHLDTANQVQFARLLARFVGAGLRVMITTHSDYIVKELNNLIMLSRDFPEKDRVVRRLGYQPEDELRPESVRAYVAENGGLSACDIGRYGIEMPVFDYTIDKINAAAIELSSRSVPGTEE